MKLSIETGSVDVWMLVPLPVAIYHPDEKRLEIGFYFLNFFLTVNIKQ